MSPCLQDYSESAKSLRTQRRIKSTESGNLRNLGSPLILHTSSASGNSVPAYYCILETTPTPLYSQNSQPCILRHFYCGCCPVSFVPFTGFPHLYELTGHDSPFSANNLLTFRFLTVSRLTKNGSRFCPPNFASTTLPESR